MKFLIVISLFLVNNATGSEVYTERQSSPTSDDEKFKRSLYPHEEHGAAADTNLGGLYTHAIVRPDAYAPEFDPGYQGGIGESIAAPFTGQLEPSEAVGSVPGDSTFAPIVGPTFSQVYIQQPVPVHIIRTVPVPVLHPVPVRVPHPVPVPQPVPYEVTVIKKVPYPVEKRVPYQVNKPYPVEIIKPVPVTVLKPYPVHVPIYKVKHYYAEKYPHKHHSP